MSLSDHYLWWNSGHLVCCVVAMCKANAKQIIQYFSGNSNLAMILNFGTFLLCKTGHLKGEIMMNIGLVHNIGNINAILA